jgi:hypothetical protein
MNQAASRRYVLFSSVVKADISEERSLHLQGLKSKPREQPTCSSQQADALSSAVYLPACRTVIHRAFPATFTVSCVLFRRLLTFRECGAQNCLVLLFSARSWEYRLLKLITHHHLVPSSPTCLHVFTA